MQIPLGFEVGTGTSVELPLRHMVVTGQTQEAGKTTALEALITRSGLRAVTFITKRGEGSFTRSRRIDPHFREQADWEFVRSILEASRGEKLKFERAWIIRASKGARTLADVQKNVRKAMEKAHGLSADVYLTLDAYLDAIVPTIARVRWAPRLELEAGVNAVDLTGIPGEMQHLVIKSSLDWVLEHEENTVVVIPEAWKFMPQGRNTPVKLAAQAFIRQGAGLKNYLWLDSQDLGGVDKETLRSVPVWLLGVQREANEIKRTLDNIPAGIAKPSKADIATLELGQFFACWKKHAIRTYVQPAWMNPAQAQQVATGALSIDVASRLSPLNPKSKLYPRKESTVTEDEARALREENSQLRRDNEDLRRRLEALEKGRHDITRGTQSNHREGAAPGRSTAGAGTRISEALDGAADDRGRGTGTRPGGTSAAGTPGRTFTVEETFNNEQLYQAIKARLIAELPNDPVVVRILVARPQLQIHVQRHTIDVDGSSLRGRIGRLIADGFFEGSARTSAQVLDELLKRGANRPSNIELGNEMKALCDMGFFTRDNKWYSFVPGMETRVHEKELVS